MFTVTLLLLRRRLRESRPIVPASISRLRSAALRLNGDQTAEKGTGSGSSANGRNTMSGAVEAEMFGDGKRLDQRCKWNAPQTKLMAWRI